MFIKRSLLFMWSNKNYLYACLKKYNYSQNFQDFMSSQSLFKYTLLFLLYLNGFFPKYLLLCQYIFMFILSNKYSISSFEYQNSCLMPEKLNQTDTKWIFWLMKGLERKLKDYSFFYEFLASIIRHSDQLFFIVAFFLILSIKRTLYFTCGQT